MLERVEHYFDHVLVHGDPALIPFDTTFPHAAQIADKLSLHMNIRKRLDRRAGNLHEVEMFLS